MIATSLSTMAIPFGIALSYAISAIFVRESDNFFWNRESARTHVFHTHITEAGVATVIIVIVALLLRERPS